MLRKSLSPRSARSLSPGCPRISCLDVTGKSAWADRAPNSNTRIISGVSWSFAGVSTDPSDVSCMRPAQKTCDASGRLKTAGESGE